MRSLWSVKKREAKRALQEKMHRKRLGNSEFLGDPDARARHEAQVRRVHGRSTGAMAAACNDRTQAWNDAHGARARALRRRIEPTHPSLFKFRERDRTRELHPRDFVSVAPDSLCPRKFLAGGGKLDAPRSALLRTSPFGDTSRLYSSRPPPRLVQPPYRNWEYPLRERDPTRDVGPSGGSTGGMIYRHFSDTERIDARLASCQQSLSHGGASPWDEKNSRLAHHPHFRAKPNKRKWRSSTAPGGFALTDPAHWAKTTQTNGLPNIKPMTLDTPWGGPPLGNSIVHKDTPGRWTGRKRFYPRSSLEDYQQTRIERVLNGSLTSIGRKPGHSLRRGEAVQAHCGRSLRATLSVDESGGGSVVGGSGGGDGGSGLLGFGVESRGGSAILGDLEWHDGSSELAQSRVVSERGSQPKVSPLRMTRDIGRRAYLQSSRAKGRATGGRDRGRVFRPQTRG